MRQSVSLERVVLQRKSLVLTQQLRHIGNGQCLYRTLVNGYFEAIGERSEAAADEKRDPPDDPLREGIGRARLTSLAAARTACIGVTVRVRAEGSVGTGFRTEIELCEAVMERAGTLTRLTAGTDASAVTNARS